MSLLSSLRDFNTSVSNKVNSAKTSIGNAVSSLFKGGASQTASAMEFPLAPGASLSSPNMSVAPNMSTPLGPAYGSATGPVYNNPAQQAANALLNTPQTGPNMSVDPHPTMMSVAPTTPEIRSSTFQAPTDQYGRMSSSSTGTPYYLDNGQLVTPNNAFSGLGGVSSQNFNITTNPITGSSGAMGLGGGGSNFTGLLGGAGGQGTPSTTNQGDETARKKESQLNQVTPATTNLPAGLPSNFSVGPQVNNHPMNASPVDVNVDLASLSKLKEQTDKLMSNPYALSPNDSQALADQINTSFLAIKAKYDQSQPTPTNPVLDTHEQHAFLQQSEDPFGTKQAMDQFRAQNTTLGELQGQRIEVMKSIQALNDAYRPIITDIKTNPNLPKGLAARRLTDLATKQKEVLQGFLDQQTILTQQITDQNEMVNRAFSIVTFSAGQEQKAQDNARQNLSLFVTTGAIGGFNANDITQYSKSSGISENVIKSMVANAKDPNIKNDMVGSAETGYKLVTYNTQTGVVTSTKQVVQGVGSSAGSANTQKQQAAVNNFGSFIDDAVSHNGSVQDAMDFAISEANKRGQKLDNLEYAALKDYARKKVGTYAQQQKANQPQQQISWPDMNTAVNGFLFGNSQASGNSSTKKTLF